MSASTDLMNLFAPYFAPYSFQNDRITFCNVHVVEFTLCSELLHLLSVLPGQVTYLFDKHMFVEVQFPTRGKSPCIYCEGRRVICKEREVMKTKIEINVQGGSAEPLFLTISQACQILQVSRTTLYQLRTRGELDSVNIGGKILIPTTSLKNFAQLRIEQGSLARLQSFGRWS